MELGVDVSSNNHPNKAPIDWTRVSHAGYSFAYIKATQGSSYVNPYLGRDLDDARSVGITTGVYHFADTAGNPRDNARSFAGIIEQHKGNSPGSLPPCLDIEVRCSDPNAWVYAFITTVWGLAGQTPFTLYSAASWWNSGYLHHDWVPEVGYWVASWGTKPGYPSWTSKQVTSHQYTSNGQVPGIVGPVDLSCAVRPIAQWLVVA